MPERRPVETPQQRGILAAVDASTAFLIGQYRVHQAAEPPQDAGMHPSAEVHEQVGKEWAAWHQTGWALRQVIGARLTMLALDNLPSQSGLDEATPRHAEGCPALLDWRGEEHCECPRYNTAPR